MKRPPLRDALLSLTATLLASCAATGDDAAAPDADTTSTSTTHEDPPTTAPTSEPGDPTTTTLDDTTTTTTATTTTTTTGTTTTGTVGTTTEPGGCGDGVIEAPEECDNSHGLNTNTGECTLSCKLNVCGDGLVHAGVEACDSGENNNDQVYGGCGTDCQLAKHCGDFIVQPPEECDLGLNNGSGLGELGSVPCDATCRHAAKLCFLSSQVYPVADLGSAVQADDHCRQLAATAGLDNPNGFMAWLSDDVSSPKTRFTPTTLPYVLPSGVRVANHTTQLWTTGPLVGITHTDTHEELPYQWVWTGTAPDGARLDPPLDCQGWQSNSFQHSARVGRSGVDPESVDEWELWKYDHHWTSHKTVLCHLEYRLYCFEQ